MTMWKNCGLVFWLWQLFWSSSVQRRTKMTSNKQCTGGHLEVQSGLACSKLWVRATFCILSTPVSAIWSTSSVYCYFVHSRAKLESAPFRSSAMGSSGSMVRALERKESKSTDQDELGFKPKVFWIQFQSLQEETFTQQTTGWQSSWKSYMNYLGMAWQIQPFLFLWKFTKSRYTAVWITDEQYFKPSDVYIFAHKSSHIRNYQYCPQL